mgnify:CR=1 FL=1
MKVLLNGNTYRSALNGHVYEADLVSDGMVTISGAQLAVYSDVFDTTHKYHFSNTCGDNWEEVVEEKTVYKFEKGDKIKLKKDFYKEENFKELVRSSRKSIAELVGKILTVKSYGYVSNDLLHVTIGGEGDYVILTSVAEPIAKPATREKRKAVEGEYVKIVKPLMAIGYGEDAVFEVGEVCKNGFLVKDSEDKLYISDSEYVVIPAPEFNVPAPALRTWTQEEIQEAKDIVLDILFSETRVLKIEGKDIIKTGDPIFSAYGGKRYTARCSEHDQWNFWVGKMVAMCTASGRKLPDWVRN